MEYQKYYHKPSMDVDSALVKGYYNGMSVSYVGGIQFIIHPHNHEKGILSWRLVDSKIWRYSGYVQKYLAVGQTYEIEFKEVDHYDKPDNVFITLRHNGGISVNEIFYIPHQGQLLVNIEPINDLFRWKLINSLRWMKSNDTLNLNVGIYIIEFPDVIGYTKPENIEVSIFKDELLIIDAVYVEEYGSLHTIIKPFELLETKWKIVGVTDWLDSNFVYDNLLVGSYEIEFKDVDEYQKPNNIFIDIEKDEQSVIEVEYISLQELNRGHLQLYLEPNDENIFQWRRVDTEYWRNSGVLEYNLYATSYEIEFKEVAGYITPDNITVEIIKDELYTNIITYVPE